MSKTNSFVLRLCLGLAVLALPSLALAADSHVRIVRLSTVDGAVEIDRNAGQGFEKAFLNLPIIEGTKLRTAHDGRAEVEFEDGSTVRLTPGSEVEFPTLSLQDSGDRVSSVKVNKGMVYVNFIGKNVDHFTVTFGNETANLTDATRLRLEVNEAGAAFAVFKGDVRIEGKSGTVEVSKNRTGSFDFRDNDRFALMKEVDDDPYDDWDKQQDKYHQVNVAKNSYSPYSYGTSDLSYYGVFQSVPGYGMMWQPYFADASWNPYMDGAWSFYPGFGWTWVSAYPWGWMPYRYGSWAFVPGYGWGWQPGASWGGWNLIPTVVNPPTSFRPAQPPRSGQGTVVVSRPPTAPGALAISSRNQVVIRSGSAGLGIARGALRNPARVSSEVSQRGSVIMNVRPTPMPMPLARGTGAPAAGPSMPRGSAPPSARSGPSNSGMPRTASPPMRSAPSSGGSSQGSMRSAPSSMPSSSGSSMPRSTPSPAASGSRR